MPLIVPAPAPVIITSVEDDVPPIVLPPSTLPPNTAPGLIDNWSANPRASPSATGFAFSAAILPVFTTTAGPPLR